MMNIELHQPFALNEIGGRGNNEDSVFPTKGEATTHDRLFMVCDGVGGAEKGEVASKLACESFAEYFSSHNDFDAESIQNALDYTQQKFSDYLNENPLAKGMGTTLTLVYFTEKGAYIAHVGDSRVYQVRNGQIVFQTSDHSLVNELVRSGLITEEQARTHPQRNVITRAIQGNSGSKIKADISFISDINEGDYFFLCSDGILEQVSNSKLCEILSDKGPVKEKIESINQECFQKTRDNYSAYLIQVKEIENIESSEINSVEAIEIPFCNETTPAKEIVMKKEVLTVNKSLKRPSFPRWVLWSIIVVLAGALIISLSYPLLSNKDIQAREKEKKQAAQPVKRKYSDIQQNKVDTPSHKTEAEQDKRNIPSVKPQAEKQQTLDITTSTTQKLH